MWKEGFIWPIRIPRSRQAIELSPVRSVRMPISAAVSGGKPDGLFAI